MKRRCRSQGPGGGKLAVKNAPPVLVLATEPAEKRRGAPPCADGQREALPGEEGEEAPPPAAAARARALRAPCAWPKRLPPVPRASQGRGRKGGCFGQQPQPTWLSKGALKGRQEGKPPPPGGGGARQGRDGNAAAAAGASGEGVPSGSREAGPGQEPSSEPGRIDRLCRARSSAHRPPPPRSPHGRRGEERTSRRGPTSPGRRPLQATESLSPEGGREGKAASEKRSCPGLLALLCSH